ncbi:hypothetical protein CTI12_AA376040 [Artemisia annua]|uniref:Uncharacterized protein n=1 Tax=Artemisia annua TaxID=35608 RepID=A0A2U1MIS4_ARTAN|nr:hypothetical protein CTI12_AA376040 [Artemisia annua]
MVADLFHGFQKRKIWFPCKYFSLNAASITVIAVAMKLPVDLSSPMPGALDQATKLGSMAFMCTMMANLMPSLASMDNKSLFANFIGLVILVITMIVNICIEINTGVIGHKDKSYLFAEVAYSNSTLKTDPGNEVSSPKQNDFTIKDILHHSGGSSLGKEAEVLWHAVLLVAVYFILKSRNMKVFKGKMENGSKLFKDIQLKAFEWISRRSKRWNLQWEIWLERPYNCARIGVDGV